MRNRSIPHIYCQYVLQLRIGILADTVLLKHTSYVQSCKQADILSVESKIEKLVAVSLRLITLSSAYEALKVQVGFGC